MFGVPSAIKIDNSYREEAKSESTNKPYFLSDPANKKKTFMAVWRTEMSLNSILKNYKSRN